MNTRIRMRWLASAVFVLAVAGCSNKLADNAGDASARAEVTLTRIVRADISETLSLTGTAAAPPNGDVRVSALVSGRIAALTVAEGDSVEAGQILAKLDDRSYRDQLQQAEAAAQQAKANLDNARLTRTRNEDLFQRGIVARKDLEDARTQESVATAAMQQSGAALELARLQVARCDIVSPINGIVAKRFVSVGEQVDGSAAQPIVEVANLREVEFLGNAPAMYLAKMHAGQPVEVTTESAPGKVFQGRVVAISPAVDPATGVGLVRIRVPNPNGLLRMGVFLSAQIAIDTHAHALTVAPEAVYRDQEGQPRIFVVNQDSATAVPVKLGIQTKERVELLGGDSSGVKEGDSVILTGGYGLGDKARIQTRPQSNQ
ncbi:MAG: efflux RND transporter periplasmic adaptor subunit [Acidobacteriia bacterium]|nr:efflux RND transporter periplasmic adaptor subunit [Terriglobia bacterium]